MNASFRSGVATLVGRPNTGKSTLVNALVGKKIAAVTPHPQTTRTHLLGVVAVAAGAGHPAGQIVLVDTPGVHAARSAAGARGHGGRGALSRGMARSVRAGLEGRDLSLFLCDASRAWGREDAMALELAQSGGAPVFLLLNKIDLLPRRDLALELIAQYRERGTFAHVVPISALRGENLDRLRELILEALPQGPAYFPSGQSSDQPEQFWISEIIREQAMLVTQAEVPHSLAVRLEGDRLRQSKGQPLRVLEAALICERPGQKPILIGRHGANIRRIGTAARAELEKGLGTHVFLQLQVLVREGWRERPGAVSELDFHNLG